MIRTKLSLDPTMFDRLLLEAEGAPAYRVNITKGPATPKDDKLQWIGNVYTDNAEDYEAFDISGLRNLYLHYPELVRNVVDPINKHTGLNFQYNQMAVVRTRGNIAIHKDVGSWRCKINFGIRNSLLAETWMYDENKRLASRHQLEDGVGYLLDSSQYHSVESNVLPYSSTEYRYFVTLVSELRAYQVLEQLYRGNLVDREDSGAS